MTPLEPEDLFALSRGLDRTLDRLKDLVNESEVMSTPPDAGLERMARALVEALRRIEEAVEVLGEDRDCSAGAADEAIRAERVLEHAYLTGMGELLSVEDRASASPAGSSTAVVPASGRRSWRRPSGSSTPS